MCAVPAASEYTSIGFGGVNNVRRGDALFKIPTHRAIVSFKSSVSGWCRPIDFEYCLAVRGLSKALPILPNSSEWLNPKRPLSFAA